MQRIPVNLLSRVLLETAVTTKPNTCIDHIYKWGIYMKKAKMLNKVNLSVAEFDAADVNNDGKVDISDLAMVKAHMLGKIKITK